MIIYSIDAFYTLFFYFSGRQSVPFIFHGKILLLPINRIMLDNLFAKEQYLENVQTAVNKTVFKKPT